MSQNFNTIIQILLKRPILAGALLGAIVLSLPSADETVPNSSESKSQSATAYDFALSHQNRAVVIDPVTYGVTLKAIDNP